jgi:hypothetical protein
VTVFFDEAPVKIAAVSSEAHAPCLDEGEARIRRNACLGGINGKRPEDLMVACQNRLGPSHPYPVLKGKATIFPLLPRVLLADSLYILI